MSRFWHRRIYEVAFLLSLAIIALYTVPIFTNIAPNGLFGISIWVAISAGLTAAASVVLYILSPKEPSPYLPIIVYLLLAATTGLLVVQSGGTSSPFIALWMLVSFFGGIFAIWGIIPILGATATFVASQYLANNLNSGLVAMVAFSTVIPAIISFVVWREHKDDESNKTVKNLTSELSEIANKSEIVINAIGDGVVAVDSQGLIQLINPAGQEILGWGKQDAMTLNYKSILQMTDVNNAELDPANDPIQQVLNTNQEVRSDNLIIKTKSGKKISAALVVSPIGSAGAGVIVVFRDVTKEKAEEREQAEFISTASHEMRTPVASIEGYLGLAMNPNTAQIDDKAREFITKAHESAQHLGRLFQDLLDVSKSEDGRMANTPKVADLSSFTQDVVQSQQDKAKEKGLELIFVPTSNPAQKTITPVFFVNQDNDHLREVLDNLVENAIKYTPKGTVSVDVNGTDDKVVVSVKDTGLGIPAEDIPHLFQKFYRIDNPDRQEIGGTGLGLYLSRRLAEAMQGRLWVESVYRQGSTFFLELPRITSTAAEELKAQQATQAAKAATEPIEPAFNPDTQPSTPAPGPTANTQPESDHTPVKAATTVPRGESLTREQIAAHVRQLEAMARGSQSVPPRPTEGPTEEPKA